MKVIKRKIKKMISYMFRPLIKIFYSEKILNTLTKVDPLIVNKGKKSFLTLHLRPSIYELEKLPNANYKEYGIIVQGPLVYENNFTLNTLKYYNKVFKGAKIILSTWDTEKKTYIELIKKEGIEVLLNKYPENSGILNINYQISNTKSAINYIKNNCKYILKTRSDTRIYSEYSLIYLKNLLKTYPSKSDKQKHRIIGIDINTSKFIPFSFSDVMQFGDSSDMQKMWNIGLCTKDINYKDFFSAKPLVKDIYENNNPEVYLTLNYLKKINYNTENSYESYYRALADCFIIIDKEMINFYWQKYSIDEYSWIYKYRNINLQEKIRYNDWLLIANGLETLIIDYSYFNKQL